MSIVRAGEPLYINGFEMPLARSMTYHAEAGQVDTVKVEMYATARPDIRTEEQEVYIDLIAPDGRLLVSFRALDVVMPE